MRLLVAIAFTAGLGWGQVLVEVRTNQSDYVAGEPIFVVVVVTNAGLAPVSYSGGDAELSVTGQERRHPASIRGCFAGVGSAFDGFGGSQMLEPGETLEFWHLLKGYQLPAGDYTLKAASGKEFDASLKLIIRESTENELKQRFAPWVTWSMGGERQSLALEAIAEMAPTFLEKTIAGFENRFAVEGLGHIATAESRHDLIRLFEKSSDTWLQHMIVENIAGIATTDEVPFFIGHLDSSDSLFGELAALGLGHIGGKGAVRALETSGPEIRGAAAVALGNTRDLAAIPVLIRFYGDRNEIVRQTVCNSLLTLTHLQWCDGDHEDIKATQTRWRDWWKTNESETILYDTEHCPTVNAAKPLEER